MDKKSKILIIIVSLAIVASVGVSFYKYVITKNYQIFVEIPCDPAVDNCFVRTEEDDTISNYKILSRQASNIPLCVPENNPNCRAMLCEQDEPNCEFTTCSAEDLPEGESCSR